MLKDNVILDGFIITPELLEEMKSLYYSPIDTMPEQYVANLSEVQDVITKKYLEDKGNSTLFNCIDAIIMIKDNFKRLLPIKVGLSNEMLNQIHESWQNSKEK